MTAAGTDPRVGIGYDIHRLEADTRLDASIPLGGVRVPCPYRVIAHSDGDVLLHALCDALLGSMGIGDLGELFPDRDPTHRDRDSRWFVSTVLGRPEFSGWRIASLDSNIIAQAPRLGAAKPAIRAQLAALTGLPLDRVGVKARTNEGCDAVGRIEAIQAQVVLLLVPC